MGVDRPVIRVADVEQIVERVGSAMTAHLSVVNVGRPFGAARQMCLAASTGPGVNERAHPIQLQLIAAVGLGAPRALRLGVTRPYQDTVGVTFVGLDVLVSHAPAKPDVAVSVLIATRRSGGTLLVTAE